MSSDQPVWYAPDDTTTMASRQTLTNLVLVLQADLDQARALIRELTADRDRLTERLVLARIDVESARQQYERVCRWWRQTSTRLATAEEACSELRRHLTGEVTP